MNQNDTVTYYSTSDNGRCGHGYRVGGGSLLKSASVVSAPRNGTLRQTGQFQFAYQAKPGFKGKDGYTIKVCGNSQGRDGCSTLNYDMTVQ